MQCFFIVGRLLFLFTLLNFVVFSLHAAQGRLAIFQFNATSMDVVGIESEVAYSIRNELSKKNTFEIVSQREMEIELARNDIAQTFDRNEARRAAKLLGVDYILIGKVKRVGGKILADVELMSPLSSQPVETWVFSFNNQQDIEVKSISIADEIVASINGVGDNIKQIERSTVFNWTSEFEATINGVVVNLNWVLDKNAPSALGFNIYRSTGKSEPFSYITSVVDTNYQDDLSGISGNIYYQIGLLKEDGEEIRNPELAEVIQDSTSGSTIFAPIIVKFSPLRSGPEVEILPSAKNAEAGIVSYQLLRKLPQGPWLLVDQLQIDTSQKDKDEIKRYKLKDENVSEITSDAQYSVRAASVDELGQLSESFKYNLPDLPKIFVEEKVYLRKVNLYWNPINNAQGYYVHRRENKSTQWQKVSELLGPQVSSYKDTNFDKDGITYQYALSTADEYGETSVGTPVTWATKGPLLAPRNLKAQGSSEGKVLLSWEADSDEDIIGYAIYRASYSESREVTLSKVGEVIWSDDPVFEDNEGLQFNSRYQYAVAAINSFGSAGEISTAVEATTASSPDPVEGLTTLLNNGNIILTWQYQNALPEHQYLVERAGNEDIWVQLAILESRQQQFIDKGITKGISVRYSISVINSESLQSAPTFSDVIVTN